MKNDLRFIPEDIHKGLIILINKNGDIDFTVNNIDSDDELIKLLSELIESLRNGMCVPRENVIDIRKKKR